MLRASFVFLMVMSSSVSADPPSGYACTPGTPNKGVGCVCPAKHRQKRDAENIAVCAAAPTATAAQQLMALLAKDNLAAATELARKFDFDDKAQQGAMMVFVKWLPPMAERVVLQASRGQCSTVKKSLDTIEPWRSLFITMLGRRFAAEKDLQNEVMGVFNDTLDTKLEPLWNTLKTCVATASKDDGTPHIKAAYDAGKEPLKKCFEGLPAPKSAPTAKVVVDADGAVAEITLNVIWPDLDLKLVNLRLEMVRLDEIAERERCFRTAITGWKFKPNARGFAATITIEK